MAGALFGDVWPSPGSGGSQSLDGESDVTSYIMGVHFRPLVDGTITAVRWYCPTNRFPTFTPFGVGIAEADPVSGVATMSWLNWTTSASGLFADPTVTDQGAWHSYPLSTPQHVVAGQELYAAVRTNRYGFSGKVFTSDVASADGNFTLQANNGPYPNGAFSTDTPDINNDPPAPRIFTTGSSFNETYYGIDVEFTADSAGPTAEVSLSGEITPVGALLKSAALGLAGTVTPAGALSAVRTALLALAGAITPAGALQRAVAKLAAGEVAPAGTVTKHIGKGLAGTIAPAGTALKAVRLGLAGSVTPAGAADVVLHVVGAARDLALRAGRPFQRWRAAAARQRWRADRPT